jgi:hypothetical protein
VTIRQILEKLSSRPGLPLKVKLMLGSARIGMDAWKPGLLDKHVGLKIVPETRLITLAVEGMNPTVLTFEELEACVEAPADRQPVEGSGGTPLGPVVVERQGPV